MVGEVGEIGEVGALMVLRPSLMMLHPSLTDIIGPCSNPWLPKMSRKGNFDDILVKFM